MTEIYVESEFAPLKRVVLAQSEFCFPEATADELDTSFLTAENAALSKRSAGLDLREADPDLQQRWEQEKVEMAALLTSYGVEVLRPRLLTECEKEEGRRSKVGYSNFFSRDPFFTIGPVIIEGNLQFSHRRKEILPLRPLLKEAVSAAKDCWYLAAPQPDTSTGEQGEAGPFIEGGDVLVLGKTVFVGYSGLASNLEGIHWLSQLMYHFGYEVVPVRLHPHILHLDCALSLIRPGLAIICREAFLDGVPEQLADWQLIEVSLEEAALLMTNGLPVAEEVYITDSAFSRIVNQLKGEGIKVETIDYRVSRIFGGSFRCTTQPLLRQY